MNPIDLSGNRYGKLLVLSKARNYGRRTAWLCRCDCGAEKNVRTEHLRRGVVVSCAAVGCHKTSFKHGLARKGTKKPPEYFVWASMKDRCLNPKSVSFKSYGARGVEVCERWLDFRNFLADMGKRPDSDATIERRDVNGNYEPSNCHWLPSRAQAKNRRNTIWVVHRGQRKCLKDACHEEGVNYWAAHSRVRRGDNWWPADSPSRREKESAA